MSITVQLDPGKAASIRGLVAEFGGKLVPLHPGIKDKKLETFFRVELPDAKDDVVRRLLNRLRDRVEVKAAYVKPPDEPPV